MSRDMFLPQPFPPFPAVSQSGKETPPGNAWERLARGKTLGKSIGINLLSGGGLGSAGNINMLELRGPSDEDAIALSILVSPPKFVHNGATASGPNPNISGTNYVKNDTNLRVADPFIRLVWGIGGVSNEADIDVAQGAMLSINASFVRITGFVGDPAFATVTDGGYELSAFIGPSIGRGPGGQRTIQSPNLPAVNVESQASAVPNFARGVRVVGIENPPVGGFSASINFYRDFAGVVPIAEYLFTTNTPGFLPVPLGAYYFKLVPMVAAYTTMAAVFDLAI